MHWTNPFSQFLRNARSEFRKIQAEPDVRSDSSLLSRFVQIHEQRSFMFDIVDRIDTIAAAFDRLRDLCESYVGSRNKQEQFIEAQRKADQERRSFEELSGAKETMERCHREALALVTFAYYEISTVVRLLEANKPKIALPAKSHLEYLVGVRNKLLIHPHPDSRIKNSHSCLTVGPILIPHLVGGEGWIPLIRDWYLNELNAKGVRLDDEAGIDANIALLRSRKRMEGKGGDVLSPEERLQLKSYVIWEPDLLQSAVELARLLEGKFLSEITRVCTARAAL